MAVSKTIYLDNAATTRVHPLVYAAMQPYLTEEYFNPSSLYRPAQRQKAALEQARAYLASTIGAKPSEIRFTSGGSEADNAALKGIALASQQKGNHIIVSSVEHHAVIESAHWLERRGFSVTYLPVDEKGVVSPVSLEKALRPDTVVVSIMTANNEVGTVQPIAELAAVAHQHGALFHTDAVQAYGHIPLNVAELGVDALSVSAHKFHGPKGVGFLFCKRGVKTEPLISGGAQERGYRAGTENLAGIVGMEQAARIAFGATRNQTLELQGDSLFALAESKAHALKLRTIMCKHLESNLEGIRINGNEADCLPGILSVSFEGVSGEALLALLDQEGICASAGSACASGSLEPSHVLTAMGIEPDWAKGTIRFSFSPFTQEDEVLQACGIVERSVNHLRSLQG